MGKGSQDYNSLKFIIVDFLCHSPSSRMGSCRSCACIKPIRPMSVVNNCRLPAILHLNQHPGTPPHPLDLGCCGLTPLGYDITSPSSTPPPCNRRSLLYTTLFLCRSWEKPLRVPSGYCKTRKIKGCRAWAGSKMKSTVFVSQCSSGTHCYPFAMKPRLNSISGACIGVSGDNKIELGGRPETNKYIRRLENSDDMTASLQHSIYTRGLSGICGRTQSAWRTVRETND